MPAWASISWVRKPNFTRQNCPSGKAPPAHWLHGRTELSLLFLFLLAVRKRFKEGEKIKEIAPRCISTELCVALHGGQRGDGAPCTAAWRDKTCFSSTDGDVNGPGHMCWLQHIHHKANHGGKSLIINPCVLLTSTKKPCVCPGTPAPLLDVTRA